MLSFLTSRIGIGIAGALAALWAAYATAQWIGTGARLDDAEARIERMKDEMETVRTAYRTCQVNTADLRREISNQNAAISELETAAAQARARAAEARREAEQAARQHNDTADRLESFEATAETECERAQQIAREGL